MSNLRPVLDFFLSIPWEYALILVFVLALISERIGAFLANKPFFTKVNTCQNLLIGGISLSIDALFSLISLPILSKVPSLFQVDLLDSGIGQVYSFCSILLNIGFID